MTSKYYNKYYFSLRPPAKRNPTCRALFSAVLGEIEIEIETKSSVCYFPVQNQRKI